MSEPSLTTMIEVKMRLDQLMALTGDDITYTWIQTVANKKRLFVHDYKTNRTIKISNIKGALEEAYQFIQESIQNDNVVRNKSEDNSNA